MIPAQAIVSKERDKLERYYTQADDADLHWRWTQAIMAIETPLHGGPGEWVDPCAGGGAYLTHPHILGFDVDPGDPRVKLGSYRDGDRLWPNRSVITNPPFSQLGELFDVIRRYGRRWVSLLLPLSALEAVKSRKAVWDDAPLYVVTVGRMKFERRPDLEDHYGPLGGGAAMTYVVAIWPPVGTGPHATRLIFGQHVIPEQWFREEVGDDECPF